MKKVIIQIRAELEVPNDWEFVEHPSGIHVLKIGDHFVDFDIAPLTTDSLAEDATWSDENVEVVEQVLDAVTGLDSELEVVYEQ